MSNEVYIAYWSGEEPTGPGQSPTLDKMPDYVDIVPLFYVLINQDGSLDFKQLVLFNNQAAIKGWMRDIRTRQKNQPKKTKFTLGILSGDFPFQNPASFSQTVKDAMDDWGVDGITVDYEPPDGDDRILDVVEAIRGAIGSGAIMTAPVYDRWKLWPDLLKSYAAYFDFIETMDYSPYVDEKWTLELYEWYAQSIGTATAPAYNKIAIGVSCMEPSTDFYTPLADVIDLCKYEPPSGKKAGIMLYTLSYDVTSHGSNYPDGTFTKTVHDNLP
jgi:Glycosyl hydrolases family 18